jgi:hypothetical protein
MFMTCSAHTRKDMSACEYNQYIQKHTHTRINVDTLTWDQKALQKDELG